MRIEANNRPGAVTSRGSAGRSSGTGVAFRVDEGPTAARAESLAPSAPAGDIGSLLALQSVEDPLFGRRKAIRRGNSLLDTLEEMKADLLVGQVSEGRLERLIALITQAREKNLPGLDAVIDDIELRVRVELAKFGRFPGF